MIVESLEGGNKKRKKDCSRGKREEQKKERKMVKGQKGRRKKERKKERGKRKTVKWLEIKKQKKDALERTSLNGYDE